MCVFLSVLLVGVLRPRRSVCTGGSATCSRHRAPIDSPSPRPGFCGGRACVKSTHSQHSSTSPAGEMSLARRAPITRFVRLPILSPPGPPALFLAPVAAKTLCNLLLLHLNCSMFIRSTPRMSSMNSLPYFHYANGLMYVLTSLGPEPLNVIRSIRAAGNRVCVLPTQTSTLDWSKRARAVIVEAVRMILSMSDYQWF